MRIYNSLSIYLGMSAILMTTASFASGFALREQSARFQGASYAGAASGTGTDSIFFNPAAAGFVEKTVSTYRRIGYLWANTCQ